MDVKNDIKSIEDISQIRVYIIMGLSLLLPVIMYVLIRNVFCYALGLEYTSIVPVLVLLIANLLAVIYLHVIDYREMKMVCENTDKLLGSVLAFQPMYFVFRQEALGRPKQGAVIYAVVSTLEIVSVISVYVLACVRDVLEML